MRPETKALEESVEQLKSGHLSRIKRGKHPAFEKLLSRMLSNDMDTLRHPAIAPGEGSSYNVNLLGISLAVGRLTLDQLGQVRILDPQPIWRIRLEA